MSRHPAGFLSPSFVGLAHRGGALLPNNLGIENTLQAFKNVVELGFEYIETDIHLTRDGQLVCFHDEDMERVADHPARIEELTLDELRRIPVGGREVVPTLDEVFEALPHVNFNIDMKGRGTVAPLAEAIRRHGMEGQVCVASFSGARLKKFRSILYGIPTSVSRSGVAALAMNRVGQQDPSAPRVYQVPMFHRVGGVQLRIVTPERIAAIHAAGFRIHVWTVDEPLEMHQIIEWGVDGVITDRPDLLKRVLRERGMWSTRFGS